MISTSEADTSVASTNLLLILDAFYSISILSSECFDKPFKKKKK